jgi:DNA segregation ATPase FtsK/SpoIIIE-like protein
MSSGQQTADSKQQTAGSRKQKAHSRQQTADSRQQTVDSKQQKAESRKHTADSRQQTRNSRQQTAGKWTCNELECLHVSDVHFVAQHVDVQQLPHILLLSILYEAFLFHGCYFVGIVGSAE